MCFPEAWLCPRVVHAKLVPDSCYCALQLLGFSAVATATMTTCTTVGVAVGFVMGGAAGDALALKFPNASRPFINQLSMALAGPLSIVLFKAMPGLQLPIDLSRSKALHCMCFYGFARALHLV